MRTLSFTVPGRAAPQGSKKHVGRGRMVESSKALAPWRKAVAEVAAESMLDQGGVMLSGAIGVSLIFVMYRPLSTPKSINPPAVKRPDLDKLERAILDAVTGIVFADDSQVVYLSGIKRIANVGEEPHVDIQIWEV